MGDSGTGAVWLASYPKSGNTWLRFLLEAYRRNGLLDINDVRTGISDGDVNVIQSVSPVPISGMSLDWQLMLRPAGLMSLFSHMRDPIYIKTHFANIRPDGDLPHCIPKVMTRRAVYVVRDPRSVAVSASKYFQHSIEKMVENMNLSNWTLGDNVRFAGTLVSTWSNHVASWVGEKDFPVHVVKYEDMMEDAGGELTKVLEFFEEDVDQAVVAKAVEAAAMSRVKKVESEAGFEENGSSRGGDFFNGGGTRWQDELGPRWIKQIEKDHQKTMQLMGYLGSAVTDLRAVE